MMENLSFMIYKNLILDIGNSRIKLLLNNQFIYFDYNDDYLDQLERLTNNWDINIRIIYSSVNHKVELEILKLMHQKKLSAINVKEMLSLQDLIDINDIKGAGSDRILGLIGAAEKNIESFATIDFGTATTINFVLNNKFIGGSILPGANTMLRSLGNISSKLNLVELQDWDNSIGNTTQLAVNSGIFLATIGGINLALNNAESIDKRLTNKIFITGGLATKFLGKLNNNYEINHKPNLVIDGMLKLINKYL